MRPITLSKTFSVVLLTVLLLLPTLNRTVLLAQETATKMPSDPNELMLLAAKVNGLTGDDIQPWHLKMSVQEMAEDGTAKDKGTIEEFWAGPKKNRVSYTFPNVTKTIYRTELGRFRSGPEGGVLRIVTDALNTLMSPVPPREFMQQEQFQEQSREAGTTRLVCLRDSTAIAAPGEPLYCIQADKPILRIVVSGSSQTLCNKLVVFNGRYVPQDISIMWSGKTVLTAHVDSLESLKTIQDAEFLPPPDAVPIATPIAISTGVAERLAIRKGPAHYPDEAKRDRISGTVVLQIVIDKLGKVREFEVVSGPTELRKATIDALKNWLYLPYQINGESIEVKTTVSMVFRLSV